MLEAEVLDIATCRGCGCTEYRACPGGCSWVEDPEGLDDFCSACLVKWWNGELLPVDVEVMAKVVRADA